MGSQLRGHKSNFKDEMKIKWNTPTKNTHAAIYSQMDAETLSFKYSFRWWDLRRELYWTSHTVHKIKNLILLSWFRRRTLIGFSLLLCLWLGVEVHVSAPLLPITELLVKILDIWLQIDKGQVGNVLRSAENTTLIKRTQLHLSLWVSFSKSECMQWIKVFLDVNQWNLSCMWYVCKSVH